MNEPRGIRGRSPAPSSSRKNSSLSLAEWDFFISAMRFRGTFLLRDGEKKVGRLFRSGVGGVLKEVIWGQRAAVTEQPATPRGSQSHSPALTEPDTELHVGALAEGTHCGPEPALLRLSGH